jgi:hypothetical protein
MDDARTTAYGDLVAGMLAVRTDHASARFDLELARAEAAGTIDAATARTLRWWQRESVRAVADHVGRVLPEVLAQVEDADDEAAEQVDASADAWATATALATLPAPAPAPAAAPDPVDAAQPGATVTPITPLAAAPTGPLVPAPSAPQPQTPRSTPTSEPVAPPQGTGGPFRPIPPEPADPAPQAHAGRVGFAPTVDPRAAGPRATGAPSRRTLVAGLTVLGDERGPDRP